jgi:hypothetical protein
MGSNVARILDMRYAHRNLNGKHIGTGPHGTLGVHRTIIIKFILKKQQRLTPYT